MPDSIKPEAPQIVLKTHEDYRNARQRLGELEGAMSETPHGLLREAISAAVRAYETREGRR